MSFARVARDTDSTCPRLPTWLRIGSEARIPYSCHPPVDAMKMRPLARRGDHSDPVWRRFPGRRWRDIYTADVKMSLTDWYDGESFMATINPDSHVPEERKSFAGSVSGPAWNALSVILSGMPVYVISDSGVDNLSARRA